MPYSITEFDGVALPTHQPEDDLSTGQVDSGVVEVSGGAVDFWGTRTRLPRRHTITHKGMYTAADDSLEDQTNALKAKVGKYGALVRYRDRDVTPEFKYAHLLAVKYVRTVEDAQNVAHIECVFDSVQKNWKANDSTYSHSIATSASHSIPNAGLMDVEDAVITITAATTITSLHFENSTYGIDFTWTGTLAVGKQLIIDTGAFTVTNDGADAYDGLVLNSGHTIDGWLLLPVGTWGLTVTVSGTGTMVITFWEQYQ